MRVTRFVLAGVVDLAEAEDLVGERQAYQVCDGYGDVDFGDVECLSEARDEHRFEVCSGKGGSVGVAEAASGHRS
ncbi:hypothetical protein Adi01nite_12550 [Amorphoplanes digitatis]|uniref:Uncharacterized protein n=1 Tax=Actinoplanes digitatis TaxID=1868 RepID=A0A7W7HXM0_9ACTN|nr:hypothetical protein [Actinoplanes digitatis]MBB4762658.1 hypothetical protein [Actinoplanes digitatis]BFE71549.1 hypothetical protein GCM10020092_048500 [Actinoplanes digitatis]GID91843.1 hypothetical protein Adi01nite_12550 [Actinoplanes digitatis]